jgi:hypothetical protein
MLLRDSPRHRGGIGGVVGKSIGAVGDPFAVAMPALIDRDDRPALIRDPMRRLRPSMPRLPAAMEEERGARAMADLVRDEPIAGGAGEELAHAGWV